MTLSCTCLDRYAACAAPARPHQPRQVKQTLLQHPASALETKTEKLIVEIKAANDVTGPIVQAKARAAEKWIGYANAHAAETHGKQWRYALIPHDAVGPSATLAGLIARYQTHSQQPVAAVYS
jgi:hypothetical protein